MNKGQKKLIIIWGTIVFIELTILLYNGAINDFIPQPVASAVGLLKDLKDPKLGRGLINSPAYIYLLSFIIAITKVNPVELTLMPLLTLPYFLSFLMFAHSLYNKRNSKLIVLLLSFMMLNNSIVGSGKTSIYTHGFGAVLYYSAVVVLAEFIRSRNNPKIGIIFIVLGTTLVMLSYDIAYQLIIFVITLTLILSIRFRGNSRNRLIKSILLLLAAPIVVLFSFEYVYNTFIPIFRSEADVFNTFVALTKFQAQYLGSSKEFLEGLVLRYPTILTTTYSVKYVLYIIPILITILVIIKRKTLRLEKPVPYIYISLFISSVIYAVAKLLLEQIVMSWIFVAFLVSVLSLTYLDTHRRYINLVIYLLLILLISLNVFSIQISTGHKIVHKDPQYYPHVVISTKWGITYGEDSMKIPDVFTYSWALLAYSECGYSCIGKTPEYLPERYVFNLYLRKSLPKRTIIPVNYRSEYVELFAWRTLKPFNLYRNYMPTNPSTVGIIYSLNSDFVIVYTGRGE